MKEIFMQMREEDFDGDLEDYLQELDERNHHQEQEDNIQDDILCPNCFKDNLVFGDKSVTQCVKCGQNFVLIGPNQVKFE